MLSPRLVLAVGFQPLELTVPKNPVAWLIVRNRPRKHPYYIQDRVVRAPTFGKPLRPTAQVCIPSFLALPYNDPFLILYSNSDHTPGHLNAILASVPLPFESATALRLLWLLEWISLRENPLTD